MKPGSGHWWLLALMCTFVVALSATAAPGASSTTVISVTVPTATDIVPGGCLPGVADKTNMGVVLPTASKVTTLDCTIAFGSSNESSMLRISQSDQGGLAMWRQTMGAYENAFDTDGRRSFDFAGGGDNLYDVVRLPDDRLFVVGDIFNGANSDAAWGVFKMDGSFDTAFGGGDGHWESALANNDHAYGAALQADGKIVVVGDRNLVGAMWRFNADGTPDNTFDTDGFRTGFGAWELRDVLIQPDGKIVAGGTNGNPLLARVDPADGSLDNTFAGDGTANLAFGGGEGANGGIQAIAIDAGGSIWGTGQVFNPDYESIVTRVTAAGVADITLDGNGILLPPLDATNHDWGMSIVALPSGKVRIGGSSNHQRYVLQLNADNSYDTSYHTTGIYVFGPGADETIDAMWLQYDGSYFVVGEWFETWRMTPDGEVDPNYGFQTKSFGGGSPRAHAAIGLDDGGMAIVGRTQQGAAADWGLIVLKGTTVSDYVDATSDWNTAASTNMFGACLSSVSGGASAQWTVDASCNASDGTHWNDVPPTPDKVAYDTTMGPTTATVAMRFGFRASSSQSPGSYFAPITFDVLAPNV